MVPAGRVHHSEENHALTQTEATAETIDKDGWVSTGDAGYVDEDGALYIADRIKDIIIRGGENISSEEVENALYLDDRIAEAASVPVPDDYLGELVALAVSLAPGKTATPESIIAAAESRLRKDARPVFVYVSDELLRESTSLKDKPNPLTHSSEHQRQAYQG